MRTATALAALAIALTACKQERPPRRTSQAPAAVQQPFTLRDLSAATALDARLARVSILASRLELAGGDGPQALSAASAALGPRLTAALAEAERALADVAHPADRPLAERAVAAARRWPALARELAAATAASPASLEGPRDELGRAVYEYRHARSQLPLVAAPEVGAAAAFTGARVQLERAEADAARRLPAPPRDEGHEPVAVSRRALQAAASRAREAAAGLEPEPRAAALRWVDAQAEVVERLLALGAAPETSRRALSLGYLEAKADALDAMAEYQRIRAGS
jgi:hypothetical protein